MKGMFAHAKNDIPASIVVLLVAIPLCLGIALGSKAPLFSGIVAGIVGGIVVGFISGSPLSVSGPAAGLTVIVAGAIEKLPTFEIFLMAVVMGGAIQLILGFLKAGILGDYVPNSVIKGMLAAIGIILILKQFPHLVGYDKDYQGDETFLQTNDENTFSGLLHAISGFTPTAVFIGLVSLAILIIWEFKAVKKIKLVQLIPGPLMVVIVGVVISEYFKAFNASQALEVEHLVNLPVAKDLAELTSFLRFPDIAGLSNPQV